MAKITIYFQDLNKKAQAEIREAVRQEMEELGDYSLREGERATDEKVDDYINRNNFANEFEISLN